MNRATPCVGFMFALGLGSEEAFVFDSKSENGSRAVKAAESVLEAKGR